MKTFLSSTYVDLVDHRAAAAEAIERLGQQVGRMEVFGARPDEPAEACLTEIEECDLFVGIYAHRYGYVPDGGVVSITEAEFDHANGKSKPLFCFLIDEDHPWSPKMIEDEPGKSKLRSFKAKIGTGMVLDTFTTSEDLAYKIAAALGRYLSTRDNAGDVATSAPQSHTEFFDKILYELASLHREVQGHKELLDKVNHVADLLQLPGKNVKASPPMNNTFPFNFEGCWVDSETGTSLYAQFVDNELLVPYCYGGNSYLTGVFFDFRKRSEGVFFARYKWFNSLIQGFAFIEVLGSDKVIGGWWYSQDVPKETLADLERLHPDLPRMNGLALSRQPKLKTFPKWVDEYLSTPKKELWAQLHTDA